MTELTGKLLIGKFSANEPRQGEIVERTWCPHQRYGFRLDEDARLVQCVECKQVIDPFEVLLEYARDERMARNYRGEVQQLMKQKAALEDEERKAKARTRNASRKDAEHAVAEEKRRQAERDRSAAYKLREIIKLARVVAKHLGDSRSDDVVQALLPDSKEIQ